MIKIYLSGAIFNKDMKEAKKEFSEAERKIKKDLKALKIDKNYCEIINPFRFFKVNKKYSYKDYLREDIKVLCDCNILINIKNEDWEKSIGARLEREIARVLFIDIFTIEQFESFTYRYDFKRYMIDFFTKE